MVVASLDDAGYRAAYAVAEDNLRLGHTVVADSVNPVSATRRAWIDVANRAGVGFVQVEIMCSDQREHRRRVERRTPDIAGHRLPTWSEVVAREYRAWDCERIVIDTARESVSDAVAQLREIRPARRPANF